MMQKVAANVLIILTHAQAVRQRYYDGIKARFPDITLNVVDHHSKAGPYLASADALLTFGTMTYDRLFDDAPRLRWIQALGTGTDGITDLPSFRPDIAVTNIRGIHGATMSEAALMAMLALARDLPRAVRAQDRHAWERWPSRLLDRATVGIFGIGAIAETLAPRCKAIGMTVVGISSVKRAVAGFDRILARDELLDAVRDLDFLVVLTPYSVKTKNAIDEFCFRSDEAQCLYHQPGPRRRRRRGRLGQGLAAETDRRRGIGRLCHRAARCRSSTLGYEKRHHHRASGRAV